jgi:EmrB/QacA subfamily drug resistance transporter
MSEAATTPTAPEIAAAPPRAVLPLAALALAMLLASLGTSIANVALPTLADAFAAPFRDVQWVVLAYLLAITTLSVGVGRLGDLVGRRRVLLAGLALFTLASAAAGLAPSLGAIVTARVLQGAGAAVMMTLAVALVGETMPKERTGSAMGLLGTMSAIGTALGPSLGGLLIAGFGWRAVFLVTTPLGVAALLLARRALPADRPRPAATPRFDVAGTLLLAVALGAYALAVTRGGGGTASTFGLAAAALVGLGLFLAVERRTAAPLLDLATLRRSGLAPALVANLVVATVMMATLVVGPFFLARALGLDDTRVGLVMSIGPAVSALTGVVAGRLVDRFGPAATVVAGTVAMIAGAAALALLPNLFGVAGYVAALLVLTPGYQLFQAANTTAVMADVAADRRGAVSGLLGLARNLGLVSGATVMGTVFALTAGGVDPATASPAAVARGLAVTFAVAVALLLAALGSVVAARRHRPSNAAK